MKAKLTILDVYNYHLKKADQETHARYLSALEPFLPPQLCSSCRGTGYKQLNDSDACDIVPCECQKG